MNTLEKLEVFPLQSGSIKETITVPPHLTILDSKAKVPTGKHVFRILTVKDGDKRIVWDRMNIAEIMDARALFNKLLATGLKPFKVDPSGKKTNEVLKEFDATSEEIVFAPIAAARGG